MVSITEIVMIFGLYCNANVYNNYYSQQTVVALDRKRRDFDAAQKMILF